MVAEAEYGLASSLEKTELTIIIQVLLDHRSEGSDHPFFMTAVEGLLDVGDALKDDKFVPKILDGILTTTITH